MQEWFIIEFMAAEQSSVGFQQEQKNNSHLPELKLKMTPTHSRKGNKPLKAIVVNDSLSSQMYAFFQENVYLSKIIQLERDVMGAKIRGGEDREERISWMYGK